VGEAARDRGGEELVVAGRRLDADGSFTQRFGAISYAGQDGAAPWYASGIDVPRPGCWRLRVRTAGLSVSVIVRAVAGRHRAPR